VCGCVSERAPNGASTAAQVPAAPIFDFAGFCEQSSLLVPVPEAEELVGRWRAGHDPLARGGVPAHVTLVFPWIPPEQIKPDHLDELDRVLAGELAFGYRLEGARWFGDRVLWLAPRPDEPFRHLTKVLASHFGTPPWLGEFADVVPHVTVGHAGVCRDEALADVERELASMLPVVCRATEVDVMCWDGFRWTVSHRVMLGGGTGAAG